MGIKLLLLRDDSLVQRVRHAADHFHHDGLRHLGRDHLADLLVLKTSSLCFVGHLISSLPPVPARGGSSACARGPSSCRAASSTRPSGPCSSETADGRTALPFHAIDCVLRFRRDRELSEPSYPYSASSRPMNFVLIASLCAASRIAAPAVARSTPSISNRILPGRITATHCSGAPLPLPIRVSAGFFVIGLSGNSRIQTLPPRLIKRVIAIRAASIWRAVIQPQSIAFSPYSPNAIEEPRHALPVIRPRCTLRYLTFFGINIES